MLVTLPLAAQNTTAATLLDPNPYPGLRVTVQGYTLPAVNPTLRLTEGFELFCR